MKTLKVPDEWYQCLEAGTAAVRRPYRLRQFRQQGLPRLTIFHLPSFQDCTGWTIYEQPRGKGYLLQAVTWCQTAEHLRMEELMLGKITSVSPEPTLSEATAGLESGWFERQVAALGSTFIPLRTKRPIGLDGESFGVHIENEFEVEWWCEGPAEWRELVQWTHECIEHFRSLLGT